jgi:hypothetical protein
LGSFKAISDLKPTGLLKKNGISLYKKGESAVFFNKLLPPIPTY